MNTVQIDNVLRIMGRYGAGLTLVESTEEVTITDADNPSVATLLPAGSAILAVNARVTEAIIDDAAASPTDWTIGDAGDLDRFGTNAGSGALGETIAGARHWTIPTIGQASAAAVHVAVIGGSGTFVSGKVRLQVIALVPVAPTSASANV